MPKGNQSSLAVCVTHKANNMYQNLGSLYAVARRRQMVSVSRKRGQFGSRSSSAHSNPASTVRWNSGGEGLPGLIEAEAAAIGTPGIKWESNRLSRERSCMLTDSHFIPKSTHPRVQLQSHVSSRRLSRQLQAAMPTHEPAAPQLRRASGPP